MEKEIKKYCAYYRVSKGEQGKSGLGLEAQRKAVLDYINDNAIIVQSFQEVESGLKTETQRPELKKAVQFAKENKCTLIVARLDRLARKVSIFESIKQSGIDFEIVGLPKNPLVQQVLASVAEWEARAISERTKSALAELKAKGIPLGYNNPRVRAGLKRKWKADKLKTAKKEAKKKLERAQRKADREIAKADRQAVKQAQSKGPSAKEKADSKVIETIKILRKQSFSYERVAQALNKGGVKTRRGCQWNQSQVIRVCKRNGL